jgi:hypothetical protein
MDIYLSSSIMEGIIVLEYNVDASKSAAINIRSKHTDTHVI